MKLTNNFDVSWNNVFKPTPSVVSKILMIIRRIIAGVATGTFIAGKEHIIFYLFISGHLLEELSNFISERVREGTSTVTTTVEMPSNMKDQITVTTETKDIDENDGESS